MSTVQGSSQRHKEVAQAIADYYANLPHYVIDAIWEKDGQSFVQISPAGLAFYEPPDATVYRCWIGEMTIGGDGYGDRCCGEHDVEVLKQEEVEWLNGAIGYGDADR